MKNLKTFQSENKEGFIVNIDITKLLEDSPINIIRKLENWLKENHTDIYWDIEMHEGGTVYLEQYSNGYNIVFTGDNGIFRLKEIETETIEL
tara:strand:+ start:621 stop:896 length:276 start_codon:yes stop_codon:yes gene_type:complete